MCKLWNSGIATDDMIQKCKVHLASKCVCCSVYQTETIDHLFGHSDIALFVWNHFQNVFGLNISPDLSWIDKCKSWWIKSRGHSQDKILGSVLPMLLCWEIWLFRNDRRFSEAVFNSNMVIYKIIRWLQDINRLILPTSVISFNGILSLQNLQIPLTTIRIRRPKLCHWISPSGSLWKLNVDGAVNSSAAGIGCVVRDSDSQIVFAFSESIAVASSIQAEAQALYSGLVTCYQLGISDVIVETDCVALADGFRKRLLPAWEINETWCNILLLCDAMSVVISHVFRECNLVADSLAKQGAKGVSDQYFHYRELPSPILSAWQLDAIGLSSWRF